MLVCTCEGTVTGFGLANPKLAGERDQARQMPTGHPANRPPPGTAVVTDKGLAGEFFAIPGLNLDLIRPARKDEKLVCVPRIPSMALTSRVALPAVQP